MNTRILGIGTALLGLTAPVVALSTSPASAATVVLTAASGAHAPLIAAGRSSRCAHAALANSSGNRWLDDAAIATARMSRYSPEVRNCTKLAGSYLISVEFTDGLG